MTPNTIFILNPMCNDPGISSPYEHNLHHPFTSLLFGKQVHQNIKMWHQKREVRETASERSHLKEQKKVKVTLSVPIIKSFFEWKFEEKEGRRQIRDLKENIKHRRNQEVRARLSESFPRALLALPHSRHICNGATHF